MTAALDTGLLNKKRISLILEGVTVVL